jgi:molybdopterin-biosynthesis enzyme MoeA-like protein
VPSHNCFVAGIGESKVETELMDLIDSQENPTIAPLAGTHEVYIIIFIKACSITISSEP